MYAVLTGGFLVYLGNNQDEAMKHLKNGGNVAVMKHVDSLEDLVNLIEVENVTVGVTPDEVAEAINDMTDTLSSAFKGLVDKLNEVGNTQDLAAKVKSSSEKLVGEAKSLGARGMKVVGEGFVALGDLIRKAGVDEGKKEACQSNGHDPSHHCCGGHGDH